MNPCRPARSMRSFRPWRSITWATNRKARLIRRITSTLADGGVLINADQVAGASPWHADVYRAMHEKQARELGTNDAEWSAAVQRMSIDLYATVDWHLARFSEAGLSPLRHVFQEVRLRRHGRLETSGITIAAPSTQEHSMKARHDIAAPSSARNAQPLPPDEAAPAQGIDVVRAGPHDSMVRWLACLWGLARTADDSPCDPRFACLRSRHHSRICEGVARAS